ncbi:MAG: hypothetical protein ACOX16_05280 [Candidatus Izemoplasmatales bacterium]|jgi:hypothetical protein
MVFGSEMLLLAIMETIEGFLQPYVEKVLDLLNGLPVWAQGGIILFLGIFTLVGLFVFIKKFFKLFLVLAVLGVIGYFLWEKGIIQNLIDNFTGSIIYQFAMSIIKGM